MRTSERMIALKILVSACLLGENCKYSGGNNRNEKVIELLLANDFEPVLCCPEASGGLPTPRVPAERLGDRVISKIGEDVTAQFSKGAQLALEAALQQECTAAVLKKNSPSCGSGTIYDGTFTGTLTDGDGVTAELLRRHGIAIYNEDNCEELLVGK